MNFIAFYATFSIFGIPCRRFFFFLFFFLSIFIRAYMYMRETGCSRLRNYEKHLHSLRLRVTVTAVRRKVDLLPRVSLFFLFSLSSFFLFLFFFSLSRRARGDYAVDPAN